MKKIKKYFPLIIGLVILLSVAAYGTRAYFSDSAKLESNIELSLGSVDIDSDSTKTWVYEPDEENEQLKNINSGKIVKKDTILTGEEAFINVRPGDAFKKNFTFKNNGTLNQIVKFNTTAPLDSNELFVVEWEYKDNETEKNITDLSSIELIPGAIIDATMVVSVNAPSSSELGKYNDDNLDAFNNKNTVVDFVGGSVEVQAVQTNGTYTDTE